MRRYLILALFLLLPLAAGAVVVQRLQFGGTEATSFTSSQLIRMNAGGTALQSNGLTAPQAGDKGADGVTSATAPMVLGASPFPARTVACPSCEYSKTPTTSSTSGIIGGTYSSASTVARPFFSNTSTGSPIEAHLPAAVGGYIMNLTVTTAVSNNQKMLATTVRGDFFEETYGGTNLNQPSVAIYPNSPKGVYVDSTRFARVNQGGAGPIVNTWAMHGSVSTPVGWAAEFISDDASPSTIIGSGSRGTIATGLTSYSTPFVVYGTGQFITTDRAAAFASGTVDRLCVTTDTTQSATGNIVLTFMVAADTTISVTIDASALAGTYCDTTHSAAVTAGDIWALRGVNAATTTSAGVTGWSVRFTPTSGSAGGMGGSFDATLVGTQYWGAYDNVSDSNGSVALGMPRAGTTTRLCVYNSGATVSGTTVTVMKNEVASSLVLTMATGGAAGVQCATGSVSFAKGDRVSIKTVYVSGNSNFSTWSIDY